MPPVTVTVAVSDPYRWLENDVRTDPSVAAGVASQNAYTDDRVVPGHSFKYTAALQAAAIGDKPHFICIETRAGHGSGKPTDKIIAEAADFWAFAGYFTGLTSAPTTQMTGQT